MKRLCCAFWVSSLCLMTGCVDEPLDEIPESVEITVRMEYDVETKTILSGLENGMYYPLWSAGDKIAVYADDDKDPSKFTIKSGDGSTVATFSGSRQGSEYLALYPYDIAGSFANDTLLITLPQIQKYVKDSFGPGAFPMLASGPSGDGLRFMNLCSVLKISLTGTAAVRNVTLTANDENTYLSGAASVVVENAGTDKDLLVMSAGASRSVVLETKGLEISEDSPADVFIVVPSQTYKGGLTIEVDTYTDKVTKTINSDIIFERSQIRAIKELTLDADGEDIQLAKEKAALIAIYDALDGDNWINKDNWCSDRPVETWRGVGVNEKGSVVSLVFDDSNNLNGSIPAEITDLLNLSVLSIRYADISGNPLLILSKLTNLEHLALDMCEISGEIPNELCDLSELTYLSLHYNNITGELPEDIIQLDKLHTLRLGCNALEGTIPANIGDFASLETLDLNYNKLSGNLPLSIGNLVNLNNLDLSSNNFSGELPDEMARLTSLRYMGLAHNKFVGNIPSYIASFPDLYYLSLADNNFYGELPVEFQDMDFWAMSWGDIVYGNNLNLSKVKIPAPDFDVTDIDGNIISSNEVYSNNACVAFIKWDPQIVRYDETLSERGKDEYMMELLRLYELYNDKGFDVVGFCEPQVDIAEVKKIISEYNIPWQNFIFNDENNMTLKGQPLSLWTYPFTACPAIMAANSEQEIGYVYLSFDDPFLIGYYVMSELGESIEHYMSSDFSQDGVVETLQTATVGNGIDIVLMGDAYSDREIADGSYAEDMEYMYEKLFTEEPFKTHKNMFNVYYVNVVSATEGYEHAGAALGGFFGEGTLVGGNDDKCFEYALNAISEDEMDEALIIVAMNSDAFAGTCYMYYPESSTGTYSSGPSVAYFPKGTDQTTFAQLLHHEANGHGFAKLADEYAYEEMGAVPSDYESQTQTQQNQWGWWKNVDFTSDPAQVRWSYFLDDERYQYDGLGCYEGGLTYWTGVWRPTENSIMRYNTGGFNAPSREAIYYRIHKLAYGDSWEYDYEDFVEYDAVNRASSASAPQKTRRNYVEKPVEPTAPPVVVGKTWKE